MKKILLLLGSFFANSVYADNSVIDNWQKAQNLTEIIVKQCDGNADFTSDLSLAGSLKASDRKIVCLKNYINKEIEKSYDSNLQENMEKNIDDIISVWNDFYSTYYYSNKYCQDHCGSMGMQLQRGKIFTVLQTILTDLIYLNINKNPI